jgi:hypothetical protein
MEYSEVLAHTKEEKEERNFYSHMFQKVPRAVRQKASNILFTPCNHPS